jgi:hypothetical protein
MTGETPTNMVQSGLSSASQGNIRNGFLPSAVRKLKQFWGGLIHSNLSTSDFLLFPDMKIHLTGIFRFIAKIKN